MSPSKLTPMMAQYRRIRSELPKDCLLLFRLGDFYELFFEDAQTGSAIMEIALTKRGEVPMCGIPFHAAAGYLGKILRAGKKVAICDQVEEARPGKLVKRAVTQVLSPGTHFDESILASSQNNYLVAIKRDGEIIGICSVDLTTGEFKVTQLPRSQLSEELERLQPAEILCPEGDRQLIDHLAKEAWRTSPFEDWVFGMETAEFALKEHCGVQTLDGLGLSDKQSAISAAGGILHYLSQHLRHDLKHLHTLSFYERSAFLVLDKITIRNLEILQPLSPDASPKASLFGALNLTQTPMGARCLRQWISQPLCQRAPIVERQSVVSAWLAFPDLLEAFRNGFKKIRDLERTMSRLSLGNGNARDLQTIQNGLEAIPHLKEILLSLSKQEASQKNEMIALLPKMKTESSGLLNWANALRPLPELSDLIARALTKDPPLTLKEGGLIREGFDEKLDALRASAREGKNWIARLQRDESKITGIASLKVRFNSVFGYFIEVTKTHLDKVPAHYIRKQTIATAERFVTPDLKKVEAKILKAEERAQRLEYELFQKIREATMMQMTIIQSSAAALAQLDVLASFAESARLYDYCRPKIEDEGRLMIESGRHPVLDLSLIEERFVPNDADIGGDQSQIAILTGPNMAGKSTFIRQIALLALMAHTGSFIPAKSARIDLLDRIFTRIGASDDLSRGQSTFMVEMSETANILNNATNKSLVILDEVGRGTSTFDGLSLAWSIVEHLHNQVGAKTFFATHYHELTELGTRLERVNNFRIDVKEWNERILFVRRIVPGAADKSYGIAVARLAGIPKPVLERAKDILERLERSDLSAGKTGSKRQKPEREKLRTLEPAPQLDLFA